ncbi:flagellar hook-length control protein FliK [Methylobacterium oryzae]|uniref:Flagellar hook-length control protein FliK n=1 Tax=Methylobacterium oryzae TaxID=334852 RepID=A0ABU7THA8_9HYPH
MNTISAAVQKPRPKPDREPAPSQCSAGDLQKLPDPGARSAFDLVLRAVSGRATAPRSETETGEAGGSDGASGTDPRAEAGAASEAPPSPVDPSNAAAALAEVLSAVSSAVPDTVAGHGTDAPRAAPSAASPVGPDAAPEITLVGNGEAAGADASPRAGPNPGSPLKVEVLDRAVHFRPVLPDAARRARAAPVSAPSPLPAAPNAADAADAQLQPGRSGSPDPVAAKSQPAWIALTDKVAAAAKAAVPLDTDREPRSGPATASAAATGLDVEGDLATGADSRSRSGIARTVLAATGRQGPAGDPVQGGSYGSGTGPGQLAPALPTIAAAIKDGIERAAAAEPELRVSADPAIPTAPDGPLRVLKIQLRPEDLGTVTVELRLTNGQLETHLRASRPETAAMLQRDSAILTDLLKQAHYRPEITVGPVRPGDAGPSAGGSQSQGQSAFTDGGPRSGHGGGGQRQAEQRPAINGRDVERMDETVRPRDGGVYL